MGPDRTAKTTKREKHFRSGKRPSRGEEEVKLPGVQKIKSAIRQTQRLLTKDKLAADVRVQTERRLKALEGELEDAERSRKERAFAVKYHKVKFFEKKKVLRRIKQTKSELEANSSSKEPATELEHRLFDLRVDLNYILNYPKLEKYISLFPGAKNGAEAGLELEPETDTTNTRRQEIRSMIRDQMEAGELSNEPEEDPHSEARTVSDEKSRMGSVSTSKESASGKNVHSEIASLGKVREKAKKKKNVNAQNNVADETLEDDFFDFGIDS